MQCIEILNPKFPSFVSPPRSSGTLHLTEIINDISAQLFDKKDNKLFGKNMLWAQVGFIWESLLGAAWGLLLGNRPGEVERDGIVGSPDGIRGAVLEEYKCTWRSVKTHPQDVWKWMTQIKAYMWMTGLRTCNMKVLYLNGDYKFKGDTAGPQYREFWFMPTEQELSENWAMLVNHARAKGWLPATR